MGFSEWLAVAERWVRTHAWLFTRNTDKSPVRAFLYERDGKPLPYPPISGVEYLLSVLIRMRYCVRGESGSRPFTFPEVDCYCNRHGLDVLGMEFDALVSLSVTYTLAVQEYNLNPAAHSNPPFIV